jgi:hypothetical protein
MLKFELLFKRKGFHKSVLILIPLALSAFTHLWNPTGFPSLYVDEGHYMRRAAQVLNGLGPQESASGYNENREYDHPYFGQLFLAFVLKLAQFPGAQVTNPVGNVHSIEMLYMVPRVLMGILAVIDTFLIYEICERRYNTRIALIASILFAVMPLSWLLRRILLDSIQLPFLLLSILFALGVDKFSRSEANAPSSKSSDGRTNKRSLVVLLSGVFLGIAIFTKIPAIGFIPGIAFLIYVTNGKNFKTLGLWFIPVLLIPLIWPAYSIFIGEFDDWIHDVQWQTSRFYRSLAAALTSDLIIDPVLIILGIVGIAFALIKRDVFPVLCSIPFLLFLDYVGYAQYFHLIPLIPILCISSAILIEGLPVMIMAKFSKNKVKSMQTDLKRYVDVSSKRSTEPRNIKRSIINCLPFGITAAVGIFGIIVTSMLITLDLNSTFFTIHSSIIQHLLSNNDSHNNDGRSGPVFVIGQRSWGIHYSWIPKYIYNLNFEFVPYKDIKNQRGVEKMLFIVDKRLNGLIFGKENITEVQALRLVYNNTIPNSSYNDKQFQDRKVYPYTSLYQNRRVDIMELRSNY